MGGSVWRVHVIATCLCRCSSHRMIRLTGDSHPALAVDVRVWGLLTFCVFAWYRLVTCPVSTGHSYSHFTKALRTERCHCTTGAVCKYELKYVLIISHRKCLGAATHIILSQHLHLMTPCSWMQPLPVTTHREKLPDSAVSPSFVGEFQHLTSGGFTGFELNISVNGYSSDLSKIHHTTL